LFGDSIALSRRNVLGRHFEPVKQVSEHKLIGIGRLGWHNTAACTHKQTGTKPLFKAAHLATAGRVSNEQLRSSLAETRNPGGGFECLHCL